MPISEETIEAWEEKYDVDIAYDPEAGLRDLPCPVRVIATQSGLLEPTRAAAIAMGAPLTERMDVSAPVFEAHAQAMAQTIREAL